jgi:hypothetical protein
VRTTRCEPSPLWNKGASIQGDFYFHNPATGNSSPAARIAPASAPAAAATLIGAWNDQHHPTLPGAIRMWAAGY